VSRGWGARNRALRKGRTEGQEAGSEEARRAISGCLGKDGGTKGQGEVRGEAFEEYKKKVTHLGG